MTGEHDLNTLLASMDPVLAPETFVFVTIPSRQVPMGITAKMMLQEAEGTTLILTRAEAEAANLPYTFAARMVTLNVHSALDAVGFIARIATELAAHGMGVNPVAGYYHDHLFIPEDRADDAMRILRAFSA
ncbi:ACT domain-containing protein [Roseovarius pelagicus]|uniref:ACT domain-containing protein n=1 Tax=Roseovarius pelagicus TaxID=2980108 RepID=A0ABY6DA02_9RHOB|nr:ACT domain-containing protein [Roseovarius pelagicus]UXX82961.1 ACT domain-containing protein [Roseovarius pelagicus]